MNPAEWLRRTAARHPEAPALYQGQTLRADYAEFARRAANVGVGLTERGTEPGDRVALYMANRTEYLEALYGAWSVGAVVVPVNAKLHPREVAWIVDDAGAGLVLGEDVSLTALAPDLRGNVQTWSVDSPTFSRRAPASRLEPVPMRAADLAWLFYTSGTTGKPKGVMISCGNLASMTLSYFVDVDEVKSTDMALYAAPMSHGAGLYNFMHVLRGAAHVVPSSGGFDADEVLEMSAALAPGADRISMFAAPTMVRRLVDAARRRGTAGEGIRTIVYAGGPMYEADVLDAVEVMGPRFVQIYGQGECPMGITALSRDDVADREGPRWRDRMNSVGTAQTLVEVAVVDAEGRTCPPGEAGEIVVRGATVMTGYWNNPDATARTLRGGWLHTGDVGHMDRDGYLTLQDRSKDVIISGGSNIYPREVEEALLSHPDVREVSVVGRADPEWGEVVVAFVVAEANGTPDPAELDALCLDRIARFKRPKEYRFLTALPKNNYGKVLKRELRAMLSGDRGG